MKEKKLLVLHPALAPYRIDFFNSLYETFDADFYFFNKNLLNQKFDQNRIKLKINFKCNYLSQGINLPGRTIRFGVINLLKQKKPDVVICTEYNPMHFVLIVARIFSKNKFKIFTICDDNIDVAENAFWLKKVFRSILLRFLDGVILTHDEIVDWYQEKVKPSMKLVVFPIIRKEKGFIKDLENSEGIASKYMQEYNLEGKKVLLFVGRLVSVKNLERLIDAFDIVQRTDKQLILVIVGDGVLKNYLLEKIIALNLKDRVLIPGRFEGKELLAWYLISQVFVLPSVSELFGAVINEALLSGNYVLASKLAGAASLIDEGVNGEVFDPYEVEEIANSIEVGFQKTDIPTGNIKFNKSNMLVSYQESFDKLLTELV